MTIIYLERTIKKSLVISIWLHTYFCCILLVMLWWKHLYYEGHVYLSTGLNPLRGQRKQLWNQTFARTKHQRNIYMRTYKTSRLLKCDNCFEWFLKLKRHWIVEAIDFKGWKLDKCLLYPQDFCSSTNNGIQNKISSSPSVIIHISIAAGWWFIHDPSELIV